VRRVEFSIDGRTQESALREFLGYRRSAGLFKRGGVGANTSSRLTAKLKNERIFDTASNARYALDDWGRKRRYQRVRA
jgi:hypothetical protein